MNQKQIAPAWLLLCGAQWFGDEPETDSSAWLLLCGAQLFGDEPETDRSRMAVL